MAGHIWVVSELYYPEETSTGFLLTKIAEGLAETFPVRALAAQPTYSRRGAKAPARETVNGVEIRRCFSTTFDKNKLALRLVNALTITISMFFHLMKHLRRGDQVLVVTNPPMLPFATALAARLKGVPFVLLVHDVYPEALVAMGMAKRGALMTRIGHFVNNRLYRAAARVAVLGRDMAELVRRKLRRDHAKVVLIPNWADLDLVSPAPKSDNAMLRELGLSDRLVVQYAGNMGRTHGLEWIADAAERLRDANVSFLFVGSGAKKAWLEAAAKERGLTNVIMAGNKPRSEQPVFLNACDVSIISFVHGMSGVSVPSRMYNVLAAGKPILAMADDDSELALVVREEEAGWVVAPGDVDGIEQLLRRLAANPAEAEERGRRGRAAVERLYSLRRVVDLYTDLFRGLRGNA